MSFDVKNKRTWKHGKSTYRESNFRKLYKELPKHQVTEHLVKKSLAKLPLRKSYHLPIVCNAFNSRPSYYSLSQKCAYLWTINELYKPLNDAIITDDYDKLKIFMPIIRGINLYVANHATPSSMILYRGSHMTSKQQSAWKKGSVIRCPMYLATSKSTNTANGFSDGVIIKVIVPKGCLNARDIAPLSDYPESEVLFPPYSGFKVIDNIPSKQVTIKALDNMEVSSMEESGQITHCFDETWQSEAPFDILTDIIFNSYYCQQCINHISYCSCCGKKNNCGMCQNCDFLKKEFDVVNGKKLVKSKIWDDKYVKKCKHCYKNDAKDPMEPFKYKEAKKTGHHYIHYEPKSFGASSCLGIKSKSNW